MQLTFNLTHGDHFGQSDNNVDNELKLDQHRLMMLSLIEHLKNDVDAPHQFVHSTSHVEFVLSDENTWSNGWVKVSAHPDENQGVHLYEINYMVDRPWSHVVGYAEDVISAGELIVEALQRASKNPRR